jgi:hypothetical protein
MANATETVKSPIEEFGDAAIQQVRIVARLAFENERLRRNEAELTKQLQAAKQENELLREQLRSAQ